MEYHITLVIDRCSALTFRFLSVSWWKIHSHILEFLSAVFARFHVCYTDSRSQSSSVISDVTSPVKLVGKIRRGHLALALGSKPPLVTRIARTGLGMRLGYTLSIMLRQSQKSPRFVPYLHIGKTWSFSLPSTWLKVFSTKKNNAKYFW